MQITIDTNKDGPEEIRKAARLLLSMLGDELPSSGSSQPSVPDASGLFNILDAPTPSVEKKILPARRVGV